MLLRRDAERVAVLAGSMGDAAKLGTIRWNVPLERSVGNGMTEKKSLTELIDAAHEQPYNVPAHVLRRVYFLADDEEVLFADASMAPGPNNGDGFTGEVLVFTATKVVVARYENSVILDDRDFSSLGSTVDARMWLRNRLSGVTLRGLEDGLNPDSTWHHDYGDLWPPGGAGGASLRGGAADCAALVG